MENEIVSLIVPCYNVAKTLQAFLDSVLQQTYPHIQVIVVNDGSTDETAVILNSNIEKFNERNIQFTYVYQENAGLGAAINSGLKHINGEYICWADPDDFFMPDSFEKRVKALHDHPQYAVVTSDAYYYCADDLEHPIGRVSDGLFQSKEPMQFEHLLNEQSIFCSGCHMIRASAFDDVNPMHEIYPARRGQNWQLLLPVYYKYPRFFLDEPLYGYVIYPQSMSRGDTTEESVMKRWAEHETILTETLRRMHIEKHELEKQLKAVRTRYAKKRFYSAIDYRDRKTMEEQYRVLCALNEDTDDIHKLYLRNRNIICKAIAKIMDFLS